ncbi:MAG TPA: HEAT repeat domain-containing protein [Candidatus Acidoferrales bacterium]|jgi:hypothetical protein|nr:HEAT repeat domain-containing protein [Candidatus Acidoferrales bacterium]
MTVSKNFGGLVKINELQKSGAKTLALSLMMGGLLLASPEMLGARVWQQGQSSEQAAKFQQVEAQSDQDQEKNDRAQELADREQEKKEEEQAHLDRMQELYDDGRGYLDEGDYGDAAKKFSELAQLAGPQTDAALYWKAYADNKMGKRDDAMASIADLKKRFPQSRWKKDAEALEIEMRQGTGHPVNPDSQSDDDLKILALQGIMNNDPSRGIPLLQKYLAGSANPKDKSKALFLLVQSGSPQAQEMLATIARGQSNPELQRKAVEYLGMTGGKTSGKLLSDIYSGTSDIEVKRSVLRAYMMSGNKEEVATLAKKETNDTLKREAIRQLGVMGDKADLQSLYQSETSMDTKKEILQALFLSGDSARLSELALSEKNPELRKAAIRSLGLMGAKDPALQTIYAKESDRAVKAEIMNAYFLGGNAAALVAVAKTEKDPELKKVAVSKLSLMNSKEGNDYLMELLQK